MYCVLSIVVLWLCVWCCTLLQLCFLVFACMQHSHRSRSRDRNRDGGAGGAGDKGESQTSAEFEAERQKEKERERKNHKSRRRKPSIWWDVAPRGFEHISPLQYKAMQGTSVHVLCQVLQSCVYLA